MTFGFFDLDFLPLEYIQCFQNSFDQANLPPPPNGGGLSMISDEQSVQGSFSYLSTVPPLSGAYPQIITVPAASDGGGRDPYHELWLTGDFHSFSTVPAINPVRPIRIDSLWATPSFRNNTAGFNLASSEGLSGQLDRDTTKKL